jgi:hypothetical protein
MFMQSHRASGGEEEGGAAREEEREEGKSKRTWTQDGICGKHRPTGGLVITHTDAHTHTHKEANRNQVGSPLKYPTCEKNP